MLDEIIAVFKRFEANREFYLEMIRFMDEMIKILDEKRPKYEDAWKSCITGTLRTKMNEQIKTISTIILSGGVDWDKEQVRRRLIHVANYCFFLYNRLGE